MKKLFAFVTAAVMALAVTPPLALAEGYLTRHVYDGWGPVYDTTKEKYNSYETEHFQIFWGDSGKAGMVNDAFLRNCDRILENCWDKFVVEMGMTPPTTSNAENGDHVTQYKVNVILNETGVEGYGGWAFGGVDREGYPYFMCDPEAMNDWVVPHEMGHVMHFAQGRNAWEGNTYLGPWYEAIGNWFREQYIYDEKCYPEGASYRTDLSPLYLRAGSLMAVNGRGYYEAWPLLQYLTDNPDSLKDYGDNFIAKLLNYRPGANEGFYDVLAANTENSVQDTIGLFASHMATMDFKHKANYNMKIQEMLRNGWLYWQQRYTVAESWGDGGAYAVPAERAPQSYGYNIIPLQGAGEVSVTLNGLSAAVGAGWRARLVAEGKDGITRYSQLFGSGETGAINVAEGEELYLSVAATPALETATKLGLGGWAGFEEASYPYESKTRYPYSFTLVNAVPMERTAPNLAQYKHPNGGGYVAPTASVDASAYVGPNAMVLGRARVSGNAVIDGNAIVAEDAKVGGNAYIGGNAVVMGAATVTGSARVLESALIYGNYTVSDDATIKGQAILLGGGTAAGQAIAYGDLFEDEGKTIGGGAFAGYHSVNTSLDYAAENGGVFTRPYIDRLQAAYEFENSFCDAVAASDLLPVSAPELTDGEAVFDGGQYLTLPSSVLSYENAELRLGLRYLSGTALDIGGIRLHSVNGRPALTFGGQTLTLNSPYGSGRVTVSIKFSGNEATLTVNGESASANIETTLRNAAVSGKNYLGTSSGGDGFRGGIDFLHVYLDGASPIDGELPDSVETVFRAGGGEAPLETLTADSSSPWCGWRAIGSAAGGAGLVLSADGSTKVSSPVYGKTGFVLEFSPSGGNVYPDHVILDGNGKYIFAHRFVADNKRIYPGRGEQNFCGSKYVADTADQKRLENFVSEAVFPGSAMTQRGAAAYGEGDVIRITVENTVWSQELKELYGSAANRSNVNLGSMRDGDPVYTVTYSVVSAGLPRPVSSDCYKGSASSFGGIESFGSWKDSSTTYGGLKIFADSVPSQLTPIKGGVLVTSMGGGTVVFASYSGDSLNKAVTVPVDGPGLTQYFPLPEGFSQGTKIMLVTGLQELEPLTCPAMAE